MVRSVLSPDDVSVVALQKAPGPARPPAGGAREVPAGVHPVIFGGAVLGGLVLSELGTEFPASLMLTTDEALAEPDVPLAAVGSGEAAPPP